LSQGRTLNIHGEDLMTEQETPAGSADTHSLLVDSAISHAEKLRRVVELEQWIDAAADNPALARKWQEERGRLVAELHL
jgi:hypothetical protein